MMATWIDGNNKGRTCCAIIFQMNRKTYFFRVPRNAELSWLAFWEIKQKLYKKTITLEWYESPLKDEDVALAIELPWL